ncbi:MAG: zinc ribbon domain-containing protein [Acutalibacteraceae bacterium]|nr:zinc ribbon domain-containing protein [Acutalibacteraceae bacterium]
MIWFVPLGIAFFIPFCIFGFSLRRENTVLAVVFGILSVGVGITTLASMATSCNLPEGYKQQTVYEVTKDGVLKQTDVTYYQNEHEDFFVEINPEDAFNRILFKPFSKRKFEKVEAPVFENGNFVVNNSGDVGSENNKFCAECGIKLDDIDKFCSECGTKIDKKG